MVSDLYDQYISDLGGVSDRHPPLICRRANKTLAGWQFDSYYRAKSIGINLSSCSIRISLNNSHDPKKLWHAVQHVLDKGQEITLPPHQSEKSLANQFASFFNKKIKRIRGMFTAAFTTVISPMCTHPNLSRVNEVSENEVLKIIKN